MAHKLPGIDSGDSSTEDLPQKQSRSIRSVEDRQHNSGCLYQQSRGDGVQRIDIPNQRPLDVVPGEEHPHSSSTPTRGDEPGGRQGVENHEGQIRLESGQSILPPDQQTLWATRSGPIRVSTDQSVPPLLQLAARSEGTDAFLQDWTALKGFGNPPWNLIPRVLTKVQAQRADVILVAPVWKTQPWYPLLLSLLVDWPRPLPKQSLQTESIPMMPQLAVWSISGKISKVKDIQNRLQISYLSLGDQKLANHTTHCLGDGIAGVLNGAGLRSIFGTCERGGKFPGLLVPEGISIQLN